MACVTLRLASHFKSSYGHHTRLLVRSVTVREEGATSCAYGISDTYLTLGLPDGKRDVISLDFVETVTARRSPRHVSRRQQSVRLSRLVRLCTR